MTAFPVVDVALEGFRLTRDYNHDVPYLTAALQSVLARLEANLAACGPRRRSSLL